MVKTVWLAVAEGIAWKFPALESQVVATGNGRFQSIIAKRILYYGEMFEYVEVWLVCDKRKIDVAEVVINGTATGIAAGKKPAVTDEFV